MSKGTQKVKASRVVKIHGDVSAVLDELKSIDEDLVQLEQDVKTKRIPKDETSVPLPEIPVAPLPSAPVFSEPLIEEGDDMLIEDGAKLPEVKLPEEKY